MAPVPACWLFKTPANKLTFDLLTLKVVSESRVTWAASMPILVFLGLSVLDLGPMYPTDRQSSDRRQTKASLNASALWVRRHYNRKKLYITIFILTASENKIIYILQIVHDQWDLSRDLADFL